MMVLAFAFTHWLALSVTNGCAAGLAGCMSSVFLPWFAFAGIAALAVLAVLAVIYGISPFVGRSDVRTWARVKIYDVMLSLVLIFAFTWAAGTIYSFNVKGFQDVGLVAPPCSASLANIYSLSVCNMYLFNEYTADFNSFVYYFLLASGTLQSTANINFNYKSLSPSGFQFGTGTNLDLYPKDIGFKYLGGAIDLIYAFVLANDVQLIILSSSALLFSILMALGLIARIFGVTRTFGGAMIAFAIGIGLIYPLLVSMNYGFLNYGLYNTASGAGWNFGQGLGILYVPNLAGALSGSSWVGIILRGISLGALYSTTIHDFISVPWLFW